MNNDNKPSVIDSQKGMLGRARQESFRICMIDMDSEDEKCSPENAVNSFLKRKMAWMPARTALAILAWFGFINLYAVRVNLSVAIVAMVKRSQHYDTPSACAALIHVSNSSISSEANDTSSWISTDEYTQMEGDTEEDLQHEEGEMVWDETIQGIILGSFYYGYTLSQVLGGRMAELYGAKLVYGACILGGGISAILSPAMTRLHYGALITLRIVQGFVQGVSWPAMHACISRWIPPSERPRFVSIVYMSGTLGSSMTLPLVGLIISKYGWAAQFYVIGSLSVIWSCFWFVLMHNTPDQHPRISQQELRYIQEAVREGGTKKSKSKRVPWRQIFTSLPFWAILIISIGNSWGFGLFALQVPAYMKNILGFSIKDNGVLSALPFLCRYLGAITSSLIIDRLRSRNYLSITAARKFSSTIAMFGPAAFVLAVPFSGCNATQIVVFFCLAMFCGGFIATSEIVNHTDISPNFAGTLYGIENTLSSIVSFIFPAVNGVMTHGQQTLEAWKRVFWLCILIYVVTEVFYLVFASGKVQSWNDIDLVLASKSKKAEHHDVEGDSEDAPLRPITDSSNTEGKP